jgi:hypothetical protein
MPTRWRCPPPQLVRVALGVLRAQPHHLQDGVDLVAQFVTAGEAVDKHRFADGLAHREARVERRIGILKDDLYLAPEGLQGWAVQGSNVLSAKDDAAGGGLDSTQDETPRGGLAAATLPYQPERFPGRHGKTHPIHGPQHWRLPLWEQTVQCSRLQGIVLGELLDVQ